MSMVGYNLYLVEKHVDPQSGALSEEDPYPLRLAYGTMQEAESAKKTLEQLYGAGSIEIDVRTNNGTCCPGEGE